MYKYLVYGVANLAFIDWQGGALVIYFDDFLNVCFDEWIFKFSTQTPWHL